MAVAAAPAAAAEEEEEEEGDGSGEIIVPAGDIEVELGDEAAASPAAPLVSPDAPPVPPDAPPPAPRKRKHIERGTTDAAETAPAQKMDTAALLKELGGPQGVTLFAIADPDGQLCAIRSSLLEAHQAVVGQAEYAAAGLPEVVGEANSKTERALLVKEKKKPLPNGFIIVKAAQALLGSPGNYQDFALVLALAAAKCKPGAIVMALSRKHTPHYLVTAVGAAAVRDLIEGNEVTVASLKKMRNQAHATPEQIRQKVLMLLEGGLTEANDTGEMLVDMRKMTPAVGTATINLREALAGWSKDGKKAPVQKAFRAWCALAW